MHILHKKIPCGILIAVLLCLSGCSFVNGSGIGKGLSYYKYQNASSYSVGDGSADSEISRLEINWISGDVSVVYGDVAQVQFSETAGQQLKDSQRMRYLQDGSSLTIQFMESGKRQVKDLKKSLIITLPQDSALTELECNLVSADLRTDHITSAKTEVNGVSGEILTGGALTELEINTVSGDIELSALTADNIQIDSVSGGASILFAEPCGYTCRFSSVSGTFSGPGSAAADRGLYTCGDGSVEINANTVSGSLTVKQPELSFTPPTPAEPVPSETDLEPAVSVEFAMDQLLAQRDDAFYYPDAADSPYASKVVFSPAEPLADFRYLEVETDADADGNLICHQQDVLYTLKSFSPDNLLVIDLELAELLPTRAISYTDASGQPHLEYLLLSGKDNVPLLMP